MIAAGRTIRQRLQFIVVSTTLIALGVALMGYAAINVAAFRAAQAAELSTQMDLLGRMTSPALMFDDPALARQNLASIEALKHVQAVAIYGADAGLFASHRAPGFGGPIPRRAEAIGSRHEGASLVMSEPIVHEGVRLGTIYVRADERLSTLVLRQVGVAAAVGLLALAIALAMVRRLGRAVVQPIVSMAAAARDVVAQGDYSRRVEAEYQDELGEMIGAFNDMLAEIERGQAELEARVRARTAELEESNRELEATKLRAEEASVAKSAFLASMSHEIRTPMNGVIGMIDVLHQSSLSGHQVEMVDLVRESAFSLLTLIDDILDFSKIEADRLELEQVPIDLVDVFERACGLMDSLAVRNDVELLSFIDPRLSGHLLGDALRLRQVLVNLINNAIKFSGGGENAGRVSVRARLVERTDSDVALTIQVIDNGIGMDPETCSRLFSAFSQADTSTTRRFGGTGLGLVISRRLVGLMGGSITVASQLGDGSTFTVHLRLPLAADGTQASPPPSQPGVLSGVRCIAIGAEEGIAGDAYDYVAHAGATVERATGLDQARDIVARRARDHGDWIWVVDGGSSPPGIGELRTHARDLAGDRVKFVVLGRGPRREPRQSQEDLVELDGNVLTQRRLLRAVALAAGLAVEDGERDLPGQAGAATRAISREQALREGRLILVAEDNETNRKVILRQLSLLGYAADVAEDGAAALARWRTGDYVLLLTDLHMPQMDGYELTAAIRSEERTGREAPIVALSANALKGEADRCRAAGMNDYLSKPLQLADLNALLRKWLPDEPGAAAVDIRVLHGLVGDNPEVVHGLLADFRRTASQIAGQIRAANQAGNAVEAGLQAHKLKSAARSIGAFELGTLCERLESIGRGEVDTPLAEAWPLFEAEMEAVNVFLDRWPDGDPAGR